MDVIDQENTLIFKKLTKKVGCEASMYNYMYLCQMIRPYYTVTKHCILGLVRYNIVKLKYNIGLCMIFSANKQFSLNIEHIL